MILARFFFLIKKEPPIEPPFAISAKTAKISLNKAILFTRDTGNFMPFLGILRILLHSKSLPRAPALWRVLSQLLPHAPHNQSF